MEKMPRFLCVHTLLFYAQSVGRKRQSIRNFITLQPIILLNKYVLYCIAIQALLAVPLPTDLWNQIKILPMGDFALHVSMIFISFCCLLNM